MGDGSLGLLLAMGIDNTQAMMDVGAFGDMLDRLGDRAGSTGKQMGLAFDTTDKALLSNRESVRLLSEEAGLQLPRAVSGAVAEMIPAIASVGPVLLGAFLVEEIPHIVTGIENLANEWEGFGKAEQAAMGKAIKDTETLYGKVKSVEEELELFGRKEAEQAALHAKWAEEDAGKALDVLLKAEKKVSDLNDQVKEAKKGAGAFAAGAGSAYAKQIEVATAEVNRAREAWKLADEQALLAQRRAREAAAKEADKTEKEQEKAAKAAFDGFARYGPTLEQLGISVAHSVDGMTKSVDVDVKSLNIWIESLNKVAPLLPIIDRGVSGLTTNFVTAAHVLHENVTYHQLFEKAIESSTAATIEGAAQSAAAMIGGRKAAAVVEGAWDIAKGAEQIAMALDPLDPFHAEHIASAAQYFMAAASMGVIAGSRGGGGGGGGGAGGSYSTSRSGGGGGTVNNHFYIQGAVSTDTIQQLCAQISSGTKSGQFTLVASNSLYNGEKLG